ncbi:MAG: hypothetical protein AB8B72_12690 [Crocinitomicaceae bacterium]
MKKISISIVFVGILIASCCKKGPLQVPYFRIVYPSLKMNSTIKQTITYTNESINDFEIVLFEKDEVDYELSLSTSSTISKQIINVYEPSTDSAIGPLIYSDTISNVNVVYGGRCKLDISIFDYRHNGKVKTDYTITK